MMHEWYEGWGWHGMGFGWLFWMILIGLIVGFIVLLSRGSADRGMPRQDGLPPSAREILDQRLARGEIDEREYEKKRKLLEGS